MAQRRGNITMSPKWMPGGVLPKCLKVVMMDLQSFLEYFCSCQALAYETYNSHEYEYIYGFDPR